MNKWKTIYRMIYHNKGQEDVLKIVKKINNVKDMEQIINIAAREGYFNVVKHLIDKGADVNYKDDYPGGHYSPLMNACKHGHLDIAKFLIEKGADINAINSEGESALFMCFSIENPKIKYEVVKMLLDNGADMEEIADDGLTPIYSAIALEELDILQLLIDRGCNINFKSSRGTPLHWAKLEFHLKSAKVLEDNGAVDESRR